MADKIRRNCSDNTINNITFKKRLIYYQAYLMKSGHKEKDIDKDKAFCKRATIPRGSFQPRSPKVCPENTQIFFKFLPSIFIHKRN